MHPSVWPSRSTTIVHLVLACQKLHMLTIFSLLLSSMFALFCHSLNALSSSVPYRSCHFWYHLMFRLLKMGPGVPSYFSFRSFSSWNLKVPKAQCCLCFHHSLNKIMLILGAKLLLQPYRACGSKKKTTDDAIIIRMIILTQHFSVP